MLFWGEDAKKNDLQSWTKFGEGQFIFIFYFLKYFIVPCGKFGLSYPGMAQQPQKQRYPLLSVCAVFPCVQTMVWLPAFGIFNMDTDADACDCTRGLYGHRKSVCAGSWLWEKTPLPHWGLKLVSVLRLAFLSDALPTELSGCPELDCKSFCVKSWQRGQS